MESKPDLSIVIVNYCVWHKLQDCLASLEETQHSTVKLQIIVVNNGPKDTYFDDFKQQHKHITCIQNTGNFGFAHGCNSGALQAKADILLFLNPDTLVPKNALAEMINHFKTLPPFSVLATNKVNDKGKAERTERFFPSLLNMSGIGKALFRLVNKRTISQRIDSCEAFAYPDWVSGCVIMMDRQSFVNMGGWDSRFWMYSEDADLCKRAALAGGHIVLMKNIAITHSHGGSSRINPKTTAITKSEVCASHHVYVSKHEKGITAVLMHTQLIVIHLLSSSFYALVSLLFFNSKKAKAKRMLWLAILKHYRGCLLRKSWLSERSTGVDTRFLIED